MEFEQIERAANRTGDSAATRPPVCAKENRNSLPSADRPRKRRQNKFRPAKRPQNTRWPRPESVDQHQENDADNDAGMGDEKTDETQIRKTKCRLGVMMRL